MPIIFITGHGDVPMSVRAMKAGAIDFLIKPFNADTLLDAIAQAIERSELALGAEAETRALRDRYDALSNREREVMDRIVAGKLNKQVAGDLGISEITVKAHRGRVMRKMQAAILCRPREDGSTTPSRSGSHRASGTIDPLRAIRRAQELRERKVRGPLRRTA